MCVYVFKVASKNEFISFSKREGGMGGGREGVKGSILRFMLK